MPPIRHIISCAPRPHWVFRPFITIHPHPRLAHHRLIRPGCVSHRRLHEVTWEPIQSPSASATVARSLMVFRWACPLIPTSFNSLVVELATKPLQPTSTGRTFTFHPRSSASAAKSAYRNRFILNASSMASSNGTVSSTIKKCRQDLDQRTRSGRRLVAAISGGKVSL